MGNYITNSQDIAQYILHSYNEHSNEHASPIRLQKSLYFIFAELSSITLQVENKYLFEGNFEAWPYGPVDRNIYYVHKNNELVMNSNLNIDEDLIVIIDDYLKLLNKLSDFRLVDIAQNDSEWRRCVNLEFTSMKNENIMKDYEKEKRV